jgi:hypothetical protein
MKPADQDRTAFVLALFIIHHSSFIIALIIHHSSFIINSKESHMWVVSAPGTRCPKEGKPREYITEVAQDVPETSYYRRLVADGSLCKAAPQASPAPPARGPDKKGKEVTDVES